MVVTRVIVFTHLEDVFSYIVLIRVMSPFRGSHNLMLKSQRTTSSRPKRPARNIDFQFPCICRTFHVYSCKHTLEGAFIYSSDNIFTCVAMQYACGNISIDRPHMVVITYKYVAARAPVAVTRVWKIQLYNTHILTAFPSQSLEM